MNYNYSIIIIHCSNNNNIIINNNNNNPKFPKHGDFREYSLVKLPCVRTNTIFGGVIFS